MHYLSTSRHDAIFDSSKFHLPIHVIGVGATGSALAMMLAKLGIQGRQIHIWDDDTVEDHNVANQIYGLHHIGMSKVEALASMLSQFAGCEPIVHNEKVTGKTRLTGIVFLLVDDMETRKEIWDGALRLKLPVKCVIETRMDAREGHIYVVDPLNLEQIHNWESTLFASERAAASLCGTRASVGPTANALASFAVWQFIRWFNTSQNPTSVGPEFETLFSLDPIAIHTSAMAY